MIPAYQEKKSILKKRNYLENKQKSKTLQKMGIQLIEIERTLSREGITAFPPSVWRNKKKMLSPVKI